MTGSSPSSPLLAPSLRLSSSTLILARFLPPEDPISGRGCGSCGGGGGCRGGTWRGARRGAVRLHGRVSRSRRPILDFLGRLFFSFGGWFGWIASRTSPMPSSLIHQPLVDWLQESRAM